MSFNLHNVPSKRKGKTACSLCRKKKVKCDGNVPCSTCVKYKNQRCDLVSNKSSPNRSLQCLRPKKLNLFPDKTSEYHDAELISLSQVPYDLPQETLNIFDDSKIVGSNGYNRQYFGPLTWLTLLLLDEYASPYIRYIEAHKKDFQTITEDLDTYTKEGNIFQDANKRINGEPSLIQKDANTKKRFCSFAGEVQYDNIIENINTILPKVNVIWKSVDYFFLKLYPFFPLVDELDYRRHLEDIIGKGDDSDETLKEIKITSNIDFAVIGMLLIFLRLVHLGLTSKFGDTKSMEKRTNLEKEILAANVIGVNAFKVAQRCFNKFNYTQCNNIKVLQLALYIRIYHSFAPEEGDGLDNKVSRTLNSLIIQMAYSLGLNRDPSHLFYKFSNARIDHLSRKIWHFIVYLDYNNSIVFGDPRTTSIIHCDTKIPYYTPGCENCIDESLEKVVIQVFVKAKAQLEILKKVFDVVFTREEEPILNQLLEALARLESYLQEEEIIWNNQLKIADPLSLESIIKFNSLLDLRYLMSSIYFKIYIHYEKKKNTELISFYALKLLKLSVLEIFPYYKKFLQNSANTVEEPSFFYIIPKLIRLSQKFIYCLSFIFTRLKYFEFKISLDESTKLGNSTYYLKAQTLISLLQKYTQWMLGCLKNLSLKYYIAWRLYKVHSHTLSVILSDNFYSESKELILNLWDPYSEKAIDEMIELLMPFCNEIRLPNDFSQNAPKQEYKGQPFTESESAPTVMSTDFDDFWLNMMSTKDMINLNQGNYLDVFDPFNYMDLGTEPAFDYDSNLNDQLWYRT